MFPTRGSIALVGLILLVAMVSSPGNAPLFLVVGLLVSLLVVNVPYAILAVRGLSVRREHASHVKEGSEVTVRLSVTNHRRDCKSLLRFFDHGPIAQRGRAVQLPMLPGRNTVSVSYTCRCGRRGIHRFDTCVVESSSPFGLVNARRRIPAQSDLVVYPIYYELMGAMFPFQKTYSGMTAAPGARPGEGPSFFGLREYRHGDPIRKIHWPSTVRTQTVMVKEFEEDMHSSVTILLDTCESAVVPKNGDSNLEVAVRVAASLANYTLTNGHPTTLIHFDESTGTLCSDRATGGLTPILDALARLEPGAMTQEKLLGAALGAEFRNSNCIAVLLSADRDGLAELLRIRSRGIEVMAVIVHPRGVQVFETQRDWLPAMLAALDAAGIRTIIMAPEDDVQATLSRNLRPPRQTRYVPCSF